MTNGSLMGGRDVNSLGTGHLFMLLRVMALSWRLMCSYSSRAVGKAFSRDVISLGFLLSKSFASLHRKCCWRDKSLRPLKRTLDRFDFILIASKATLLELRHRLLLFFRNPELTSILVIVPDAREGQRPLPKIIHQNRNEIIIRIVVSIAME